MAFTSTVVEQDRDLFLIARGNTHTGSTHWEVWRLQRQRAARTPSGREIPDGWRPPKSSEWGIHGWTYTTLPDALWRYRNPEAPFAESPSARAANRGPAPPSERTALYR